MSYVDKTDVAALYEGNFAQVPDGRVQFLLDVAVSRLNKKIPGLAERMAADVDLRVLAKNTVVQAVLRQLYNPRSELVQQSQSAGPYSVSMNTGSGNSRGNRGLFYEEELDDLREVVSGQRMGTIHLGLSDWGCR